MTLPAAEFIQLIKSGVPAIDVRTPAEYVAGHIPTAWNLPLFTNEERAEVGTLYKQVGARPAFIKGLERVGPRMAWMVNEADALVQNNRLLAYCWRGGMRSGSVAWLLAQSGIQVNTLRGGYKAWRGLAATQIEQVRPLVLSGRTGSGKTEVLQALAAMGQQVLDLEYWAAHKGSSFGSLQEPPQPSSEHFDNRCAWQLLAMDLTKPVWLEDESAMIGSVHLPQLLYQNMQQSVHIVIESPLELRLDRLVQVYSQAPIELLQAAIIRIKKRMGPQHAQEALKALDERDYARAAELSLKYYDRAYDFALSLKPAQHIIKVPIDTANAEEAARQVLDAWQANAQIV